MAETATINPLARTIRVVESGSEDIVPPEWNFMFALDSPAESLELEGQIKVIDIRCRRSRLERMFSALYASDAQAAASNFARTAAPYHTDLLPFLSRDEFSGILSDLRVILSSGGGYGGAKAYLAFVVSRRLLHTRGVAVYLFNYEDEHYPNVGYSEARKRYTLRFVVPAAGPLPLVSPEAASLDRTRMYGKKLGVEASNVGEVTWLKTGSPWCPPRHGFIAAVSGRAGDLPLSPLSPDVSRKLNAVRPGKGVEKWAFLSACERFRHLYDRRPDPGVFNLLLHEVLARFARVLVEPYFEFKDALLRGLTLTPLRRVAGDELNSAAAANTAKAWAKPGQLSPSAASPKNGADVRSVSDDGMSSDDVLSYTPPSDVSLYIGGPLGPLPAELVDVYPSHLLDSFYSSPGWDVRITGPSYLTWAKALAAKARVPVPKIGPGASPAVKALLTVARQVAAANAATLSPKANNANLAATAGGNALRRNGSQLSPSQQQYGNLSPKAAAARAGGGGVGGGWGGAGSPNGGGGRPGSPSSPLSGEGGGYAFSSNNATAAAAGAKRPAPPAVRLPQGGVLRRRVEQNPSKPGLRPVAGAGGNTLSPRSGTVSPSAGQPLTSGRRYHGGDDDGVSRSTGSRSRSGSYESGSDGGDPAAFRSSSASGGAAAALSRGDVPERHSRLSPRASSKPQQLQQAGRQGTGSVALSTATSRVTGATAGGGRPAVVPALPLAAITQKRDGISVSVAGSLASGSVVAVPRLNLPQAG